MATTITLTSSVASPQATNVPVTYTATVSPKTAVGTVQFFDGNVLQSGGGAISNGVTTVVVPAGYTTTGSHSITATFTPADPTAFAPSTTAAALVFVVNTTAVATTVTLSATPSASAALGTTVVLTATINPAGAVGTISFFDGLIQIGDPIALANNAATISTSILPVGTHSFAAEYQPTDPTAFAASTSPLVSYAITAAAGSTTTITDSSGNSLAADPTLTPGEQVTIAAGGFTAGESITATAHSTTPITLTPTTASSTGTISYAFTVPTSLAAGSHNLEFVGATSTFTLDVPFTIAPKTNAAAPTTGTTSTGTTATTGTTGTDPTSTGTTGTGTTGTGTSGGGTLPFTGADIELLAAFALALVALGMTMRIKAREPRRVALHQRSHRR